MRALFAEAFILFVVVGLLATSGYSQERPPPWAYPVNPPNYQRPADDGSIRRVPDSIAGFTLSQVRDLFATPDWHPDEHPPMPKIVAIGRKPDVFACGVCHRADGAGGPENSSLSGLSAEYIIQQTEEFRAGQRNGSLPRIPTDFMIKASKAVTREELAEAAAYFAALKPHPSIKILETDTVPKTQVQEHFLAAAGGSEREPIGERIIELAEDLENFISRDSHVRFIAYVPNGSSRKGQELAVSGKSFLACASCHGDGLTGTDIAPRIAGRSPAYLFRQLFDFKSGARGGANSDAMKQIAGSMSVNDMIALAAYSASLPP